MLTTILAAVYVAAVIGYGYFVGRMCYERDPSEWRIGQIRPGNKRSATLLGVLHGLTWPLWLLVILPCLAVAIWVEDGAKPADGLALFD